MTDIPPPRYHIVERKGRIVVTDTWADGKRPTSTPVPPVRNDAGTGVGAGLAWLRGRLVALACLGASDDAGQPILTTHNHFDEKGPRSIVLSPKGAARLGNALLAAAMVIVAVPLIFGVSIGMVLAFGAIGLVLTSANTTARPALTRWLDGLGSDNRD